MHGLAISCVIASSACTLLFGDALGGSSEGDGATGSDGGDAGAVDGGATVDASGGGPDGGASKRGCDGLVPAPKLCEDFDRGSLTGWASDLPDGGVTGIDTTQSFSGPGSLRAKIVDAPDCTYARLERTMTGMGTKRVELRMRIRPASPFVGMAPLALTLDPNRNGCTVFFALEGTGDNAKTRMVVQHDAVPHEEHSIAGRAPTDTWSELALLATPGTNGGVTLAVSLGGDDAVTDTYTFPQCTLGPELDLYPGLHCERGTKEVFLDDLRVYTE